MSAWKRTAADKVAARDALIPVEWKIPTTDSLNVIDFPRTCGLLSQSELEITETDAVSLVEKMINRSLTSRKSLHTIKPSYFTNCLTEIMFTSALERASAIDHEYARTGEAVGPLHGLPISLKDNYVVAGFDSTLGLVAWVDKPATEDQESVTVKILLSCGAVLFCKTNVSTAMMMPETYNNVWGYTSNPHNRNLSCGGSSGGESALLALKGSPLGVGTDLGGSLRNPASFTGLFALKSSAGRFSAYNTASFAPGQESMRTISGPMSRSLDSIEMWAKAVLSKEPWTKDPTALPIPWRESQLHEKLCFGMITDNGLVRPTPPVTRALRQIRSALEAAGHRVVEWEPYAAAQSMGILGAFFSGDGGHTLASVINESGEDWPRGLQFIKAMYEKSKDSPRSVGETWITQQKRNDYVKKALDHWEASVEVTGTGRPFDGVISPTSPFSAPPKYGTFQPSYTSIWSITDQPTCVFPVTTVDERADVKSESDLAREGRNDAEKAIWAQYNPQDLVGAPIGLQMIGRKLEEEKVLKLVGVAVNALGSTK
ncbi:MAG: hypothetical protein TREMPRED_002440 [Tremellales sp. Tagirdzhanova-0007]|nr:MAG: hypothetical protein TREMPRED_002440 [Tremellales sp. Tagirdzhanova-0007]